MHWKTNLIGTASTLLLLAGCANTGTTASFSPAEIHVSKAQLAVSGTALGTLESMTGQWRVASLWWPNPNAKRARTSQGSANFHMSADGSTMVGDMNVGLGKSTLNTSLLIGVDGTTQGFVMGWARNDGEQVLPMCLAVEGTPSDSMLVERRAGEGMVREELSKTSASTFHFVRTRVLANGVTYKEMELIGRR